MLCLPLQDRSGQVFAVTQLLNRRDGQPFDDHDARRYQEFAASLSVLLESLVTLGEKPARRALMAGPSHLPVRLLQVTDPHLFGDESQTIYGVATAVSFRKVLAEAFAPGTPRPDAILVTGDIADDHTAAAYANFRRALQPYGLPVFCLPGNHDEPGLMTGLVNGDGFQYGGTAEFGAWSAVFIDTHVHGRPEGRVDARRTGAPGGRTGVVR